ncbi:MAG: glycosyltransferase, partial [Betaproteobacteria bacterium]
IAIPLVHECAAGSESPKITLPQEPYLLTVGSNLGRKNFEVITAALLRLKTTGRAVPRLVVAGAPRRRLMRHIDSPGLAPIRDRIECIANPHQADLVRLYQNALALVLPSRIEGWGLPAGEALWCGTPALCSTAPVLREVCGDLGLYFDPDDSEALAQLCDKVMSDTGFAQSLRTRIAAAQPKLRRWHHVATDVIAALAEHGLLVEPTVTASSQTNGT